MRQPSGGHAPAGRYIGKRVETQLDVATRRRRAETCGSVWGVSRHRRTPFPRALFQRDVWVGRRASELLARCASQHTGVVGPGDHRPEPGDAAVPRVHPRIPRRARFLHLPVRMESARPRRPPQWAHSVTWHLLTPWGTRCSERLLQQWQTGGRIALEVDLAHLGGFNEQLLDILQRHPADYLPLVRVTGRLCIRVLRARRGPCARSAGRPSPAPPLPLRRPSADRGILYTRSLSRRRRTRWHCCERARPRCPRARSCFAPTSAARASVTLRWAPCRRAPDPKAS